MIPGKTLSRKQIQSIRLLHKRPGRHAQRRFVVEGVRAVEQVLRNRVLEVVSLIMTGEFRDSLETSPDKAIADHQVDVNQNDADYEVDVNDNDADHQVDVQCNEATDIRQMLFRQSELPVYTVSASVFSKMTDTDTSQGLMAVCSIPDAISVDELLDRNGLLLACDRIQDPGNMGTMARTAVWFGLEGLVVSPGTVDLFHPKVVRGTAGATGVIPWLETDLPSFLTKAGERGWQIYLLDKGSGSRPFRDISPSDKDIIIVGNEANGISQDLLTMGFRLLRIDPAGSSTGVESLNASVAAAIMMAHFSRPDL